MAVVLTLIQTKQIRINTHKRNNTKNTVQTAQNTVNTSTHIAKTATHTHTHTLQNPHINTPTHYKTHTYTHPHFTKPTHKHKPTYYKTHTYTHPHITKQVKTNSTRNTQIKYSQYNQVQFMLYSMSLPVAQTWHCQERRWSVIRNGVRGKVRGPISGPLSGFTLGMRKIKLKSNHYITPTNRD